MTTLGELLGIHYECDYCIDGFQPSGISVYLGPVYMACQQCINWGELKVCKSCGSDSLYPAAMDHPEDLHNHLATYGLAVVTCPDCGGITDYRDINEPTGGTE